MFDASPSLTLIQQPVPVSPTGVFNIYKKLENGFNTWTFWFLEYFHLHNFCLVNNKSVKSVYMFIETLFVL